MPSGSSTPTTAASTATSAAQDGTGVVKLDSWLEPYSGALRHRYAAYKRWVDTLNKTEGGLANFALGYEKMGFHVAPNGDITYREWAPNAVTAHLMGDFSTILLSLVRR
jgi:1,4-alpha-glucan branching enzyme